MNYHIITRNVPVLKLSCIVCANNVESVVKDIKGVENVTVNFAANALNVTFNSGIIGLKDIQTVVRNAGYDLIVEGEGEDVMTKQDEIIKSGYFAMRRRTILAWTLAIPLAVIGMFFMNMPYADWIMLFLASGIMFFCGKTFFLNGFKRLFESGANMDTLVALSTSIAFLFSLFNTVYPQFFRENGLDVHVYFEASGLIIAFVLLGKLMEERAKQSTSHAIKKLIGLQPKVAYKIVDGEEQEVFISTLEKGDLVRVHPGEKIPVDGVLSEGTSYVDESMISGEPIPTCKVLGDKVLTGTINQKGTFVMRATEVGSSTLLAQIVRMVQEAQGSKAPVQRIVDKISKIFVPVIIAVSALTFILWLSIGGEKYFSHALLSAISVLVIACPCALGLATPTALIVGMGKAAGNRILIKDAFALENMCKIDTVVLDKTGTLTKGKPSVVDSIWATDFKKEYLDILYTVERMSEHPLATSIIEWMDNSGASLVETSNFESVTGQGVRLEVDGLNYWVGSRKFLESFGAKTEGEKFTDVGKWEKSSYTLVYYGCETTVFAVFAIADDVTPAASKAVRKLQNNGIEVHLLTGDNERAAKAVASAVGINYYKAEVMPDGKEEYIRGLQAEGKTVAMVGDGINDSQALACADVSIAMGKGTDIAIDIAMVTLMTSDLQLLPEAFSISQKTVRLIRQNLFWAFLYNVIGIPLAAGVLFPVNGLLLNPMIASAAMVFSSISVVLNSLRLK